MSTTSTAQAISTLTELLGSQEKALTILRHIEEKIEDDQIKNESELATKADLQRVEDKIDRVEDKLSKRINWLITIGVAILAIGIAIFIALVGLLYK